MLGQLLLLDAHGVNVVSHPPATHAAALGAHAAVGRVALLLQDHVLRRKVLHDRVRGQPGEAGHRREVAEHYHARAEIGVHAPVRAQEFTAKFVLNDAHGGCRRAGKLSGGNKCHPARKRSSRCYKVAF